MGQCLNKEKCTYHYCRQNNTCYLEAVESGDQKISLLPLNTGKNHKRRLLGIKKHKSKNKNKNYKKNKRINILAKTNGKCYLCGCDLTDKTMTIDHFIPKSKGGTGSVSNLLPACRPCNQNKANQNPI